MKKYLKEILNIIVKELLRLLFCFLKKSSNFLIIGDFNGERFGDNSKYLYLYLNKYKYKYGLQKVIWVTKNKNIKNELKSKNYEVYYINSIQGIYYHIKSLYHIVDQGENDINPFLSHKAIKINLWHGYPIKKIMKFCGEINKKYVGGWEEPNLLVGSKFGEKTIGRAFGSVKEKNIYGLFPRVHFLLNNEYPTFDAENEILKKITELKRNEKKILLYLPTFRDNGGTKFLGTNTEKEVLDFFYFLQNKNYILITKSHPVKEEKFINKENDVCLSINSNIDIYPILKEIDILITDYSSVYFDFLALNKEIIFNPYDLEEYKNNIRGLLFNYDEITPGFKASSTREIMEYLNQNKRKRDIYEKERMKLYELCFENRGIEEVVQSILKINKISKEEK